MSEKKSLIAMASEKSPIQKMAEKIRMDRGYFESLMLEPVKMANPWFDVGITRGGLGDYPYDYSGGSFSTGTSAVPGTHPRDRAKSIYDAITPIKREDLFKREYLEDPEMERLREKEDEELFRKVKEAMLRERDEAFRKAETKISGTKHDSIIMDEMADIEIERATTKKSVTSDKPVTESELAGSW